MKDNDDGMPRSSNARDDGAKLAHARLVRDVAVVDAVRAAVQVLS